MATGLIIGLLGLIVLALGGLLIEARRLRHMLKEVSDIPPRPDPTAVLDAIASAPDTEVVLTAGDEYLSYLHRARRPDDDDGQV